ncbi:DUF1491 family protein [Terrihabitans sp. B22-R8]|uniref:DUF1491 family protein n=1 Tax=Terrihabitans sp. B22-R8 TaxID=3425128 RepID=UPI00403C0C88
MSARLTSDFWVSAHVRRCNGEGAFAVVQRRGSPEAGAIFVVCDRLDGTSILYGAAPQASVPEEAGGERLFQQVSGPAENAVIQERLTREIKFDSDLWIVAVEDREGRHFLKLV